MELIKKVVPVPVPVETEYTVKLTHTELLELRKAMGQSTCSYKLYNQLKTFLGEN